jgi:hypothetical protein
MPQVASRWMLVARKVIGFMVGDHMYNGQSRRRQSSTTSDERRNRGPRMVSPRP